MNNCRCRQGAECTGRYDLVNKPDEKLTKNYFLCGDHFHSCMFSNFEHNTLHRNAICLRKHTKHTARHLALTVCIISRYSYINLDGTHNNKFVCVCM